MRPKKVEKFIFCNFLKNPHFLQMNRYIVRCAHTRLEPKVIGVCYYYDTVARGHLSFLTHKWTVLEVRELKEVGRALKMPQNEGVHIRG